MSGLSLRIGELQRCADQLEEELSLGELESYPRRTRVQAAGALSDLAVRLELARLTVLDPGADDPETA